MDVPCMNGGARTRNRTKDTGIFNPSALPTELYPATGRIKPDSPHLVNEIYLFLHQTGTIYHHIASKARIFRRKTLSSNTEIGIASTWPAAYSPGEHFNSADAQTGGNQQHPADSAEIRHHHRRG